ncbi:hypothetical protein COCNU_01G016910 [Cocos nucifera]|uniref:Nodulin homeobox N-terminal domain-containing protein n=1 Tax=Cocos nucifera TaxID=13894 RepID=A0A8K0HW91_COCNU|nr:hypothetical protein COCNU_01G016910 [Cocos nucifera]
MKKLEAGSLKWRHGEWLRKRIGKKGNQRLAYGMRRRWWRRMVVKVVGAIGGDNIVGMDYWLDTSYQLLHPMLVSCTLKLLATCITSEWHDPVTILLAYPKADKLIDVALDAALVDIRLLPIKLSALEKDILISNNRFPAFESLALNLCLQSEASMQFLQSLCQQEPFRDRLLMIKNQCENGNILFLASSILKLHIPECFRNSSGIMASITGMKLHIAFILLQLCEAESVFYLDCN